MRGIERTGVSDGDTFRSAGISADALKWIALLTMLCAIVGAVLLPQYPILRLIGRTAFPLFVWPRVEGLGREASLPSLAFWELFLHRKSSPRGVVHGLSPQKYGTRAAGPPG